MEETATHPSPGKHAVPYGTVLGIILILISIVLYVTGMALEGVQWPMYLYYVIFPVTLIMAIKTFKSQNGGYLSLGEALKVGMAAAVLSAIIYLIYNILFNYVIEPTWAQQVMDATRDKMAEAGNMTEEQLDATMEYVSWGTNPWFGGAIMLAVSSLFGLIYSLIAGAIMKHDRPYQI